MNKKLMKYIVCIGLVLTSFSTMGVPFALADSPAAPSGPYPAMGSSGVTIFVSLRWTGDNQSVTYDVYFGTDSQPPLVLSNLSTTTYTPGKLIENTTYYWQIVAYDAAQESTASPVWIFTTAPDTPPFQPTILSGPVSAALGINLNFTAIVLDPEGDQVFYQWDWGDGNFSDWLGPYIFGESASCNHRYASNGTYSVTVRSKDVYGQEGPWSAPYHIEITPQFKFYNLRQGYVYLHFFGFDIAYGYIYMLDRALWTMFVSNDVFMIVVNVSKNVSYVKYKLTNLVYLDEHYTVIDDNLSNDTSIVYYPIDTGFYNVTVYVYDAHGNLIDRAQRNWIIYINWKWPIISRFLGRKTIG